MSDVSGEFLELFRDEASGRLDSMTSCLIELERGDSPSGPIATLFREAHTIKGAAGMLGLNDVHDLAHVLEDILSDVRDSGIFPPTLADPLLRTIDVLRSRIAGEATSTAALLSEITFIRDADGGQDAIQTEDRVHTESAHASVAPKNVVRIPQSEVSAQSRSVHVPAEKIDRLLDLVGETTLHRSRLDYVLARKGEKRPEVIDELDVGDRLLGELKDTAIGLRTLPFASVVGSFPRAVRDIATSEGKDAELVLVGTETELDRTILATLPETLTHLLRNAVAHGIELPDERRRHGKPSSGTITIRAEQRGSEVEISVKDDGAGVSQALKLEAEKVGSLAEVLSQSGYSTSLSVSGLSGRGVGLDAVRTGVESFGGRFDVRSEPGIGTEVILSLPLALALLDVLLVERGPNIYGIPLSAVQEVLSVSRSLSLGGQPAVDLHGDSVAMFDLATVVGSPAPPLKHPAPAAVVAIGERRIALACDRLVGEEEIVVKPLGLLGRVSGYSGGAILGDGRIALLLDLGIVMQRPRSIDSLGDAQPEFEPPVAPKILVVEDFFTARELQRSILEAAGYRVVTAENGREALDKLEGDRDVSLVVSDIEMPVMDGFELTESIRRHSEFGSLPIIIITSRDSSDDRQRGLHVGRKNRYMAKRGFDQQSLLEAVEQLVGR